MIIGDQQLTKIGLHFLEPPEKEERRPGEDQPSSDLYFGSEQPEQPEQPASQPQAQPGQYQCTDEGFYADENDCNKFYRCVPGTSGVEAVPFNCPAGLAWDTKATTCNWPAAVEGCANPNGPRQGGSGDGAAGSQGDGAQDGARSANQQQPPAGSSFKCERDGFFRNPSDCHKFIRCAEGRLFKFDCPASLVFNEELEICDWESEDNKCS